MDIGRIVKDGEFSYSYTVTIKKQLNIIVDHFYNYTLITQKLAYYLLFKGGLELFRKKAHLVNEGLQSILAIKASLNLGSNDATREAFLRLLLYLDP